MKKQTLLISIIAFIIILSLKSCQEAGYEAGKERGIEDAKSYAKKKYEPEISALKTELQQITANYEKRIVTMNKNHVAEIDKMNSSHVSRIDTIESEHSARINEMKYLHNLALDDIKKSSYRSGQANMEERIGEMIDLNVNNKAVGTGWDDTVYSVREN